MTRDGKTWDEMTWDEFFWDEMTWVGYTWDEQTVYQFQHVCYTTCMSEQFYKWLHCLYLTNIVTWED